MAVLATSAVVWSGGPAQGVHTSQVTAVTARAYALSASLPPLLSVPSIPNPPVAAPPCPTGPEDHFDGVGVNLAPTLTVGALSAQVDCPALPALLPLALPLAQADVADVSLLEGLPDVLFIGAVHAQCSASPNGPVGSSSLVDLRINGVPSGVTNPAANTVLTIPLPVGLVPADVLPPGTPLDGLIPTLALPDIRIVLNEQLMSGGNLVVNAVHISVDEPILGLVGPIDIVISHVECALVVASVPDTTTTTTGTPTPSTTTTTTSVGPTLPTIPPTNPPTIPTIPPSLPGVPPAAVVQPFVAQTVNLPGGALARTGFDGVDLLILALGVMGVGALARKGAQPLSEGSPGGRSRLLGDRRPKRW